MQFKFVPPTACGVASPIYYLYTMDQGLNLLEETIDHFDHGAKTVRAYSSDKTFVITRPGVTPHEYVITIEEDGFAKSKVNNLDPFFAEVFGIEAKY